MILQNIALPWMTPWVIIKCKGSSLNEDMNEWFRDKLKYLCFNGHYAITSWHCPMYAKGYVSRPSFIKGDEAAQVDLCQLISKHAVLFPILVDPMSPPSPRCCRKSTMKKMLAVIDFVCEYKQTLSGDQTRG
mmetsp:Transcript_2677/g.4989  ORF Transcript_2677/g.4989 Transcript_2677/m.4989 type:complete len:132 (+) Transcript_2677:1715-2110(+)